MMRYGSYVDRDADPNPGDLTTLALRMKTVLADPNAMQGATDIETAALMAELVKDSPLPGFADTPEKFDRWAPEALTRNP